MKHIPIMLALALSINITSFDGSTTASDYINETETTVTISSINQDILDEELNKRTDIDL